MDTYCDKDSDADRNSSPQCRAAGYKCMAQSCLMCMPTDREMKIFRKAVNRFEIFIYFCFKMAILIEILIIFAMFNAFWIKKIYRGEYF